VTDTIWFYLG
jgi:U4/U6 small nuclear ribonucleoprotein PRP3